MNSINLNSIQAKQPVSCSEQQTLSGARLFVAALQWAHGENIKSQTESMDDKMVPAAVRAQPMLR
jgi:hypothetical protein